MAMAMAALSSPISSSLKYHRRLHFLTLNSFPQTPKFRPVQLNLLSPPKSIETDHQILTPFQQEEMGDGFYEAIEEIEQMTRDPSDVLTTMIERLSSRELQLVLVYFSQEGRDSYCALEVFDWLKKENRVDGETMELMVSISCGWIERLIDEGCDISDVVSLIGEMECVGVEPGFSMVEKVVSLYWERERRDKAVDFVKQVIKKGGIAGYRIAELSREGERGGPVGYLAWKMMVDGDYMEAVKLVIEFKEMGLKPEIYSYLIALTALVKEQKEFSKSLRKLNSFIKSGEIQKLDTHTLFTIEQYQSTLISHANQLSNWAINESQNPNIQTLIHERLLSLYTCAGRGSEAETQFWKLKLNNKEPDREIHNVILAICASQNETGCVKRLLTGLESVSPLSKKKTLSWLLRGYLKGGFYLEACEVLIEMIELGLSPEYLDRAAVFQGLRKYVQESGKIESYFRVCERLSEADLVGPCVVYLYLPKFKLWVAKMI